MSNFTDYEIYCANAERENAYRIMLMAELFGKGNKKDYVSVNFNNPYYHAYEVSYYDNLDREPSADIYKLDGHNNRTSVWETVNMNCEDGKIKYINFIDTVGSHKLNQPAGYQINKAGELYKAEYAICGNHFAREKFLEMMGPATALIDGVSSKYAISMLNGEITYEDYLNSRMEKSLLPENENKLAIEERRSMYEKLFLALRYGENAPKRSSEAAGAGKELDVNGEKIHVCMNKEGDIVVAYVFEGENTKDAYAKVLISRYSGAILEIIYMDKKEEHRPKHHAIFIYHGAKGEPTEVKYALRNKRLTERQFNEIAKSPEFIDIITSSSKEALKMMSTAIKIMDRRDSLVISESNPRVTY